MSLPERGIEAFGPNRKNLLWLPPLTLGYVYHLVGTQKFLVWGIASCAGAMVLYDWATELIGDDTMEIDSPSPQQVYGTIPNSVLKRWLLVGVLVAYLYAAFLSLKALRGYFTSDDLILVGLSFAYIGGLITWVLNGKFLLRSPSEEGVVELDDLHPNIPGPMATVLESSVGFIADGEEGVEDSEDE